ncbi:MAG: endonuclease III [Alphaproteobacteria bacterium]
MNPKKVDEFFKLLKAQNPHPKGELYYTNSFTLLVAVILSAQATDVGVNKVTKSLFEKYDTPKKIVALGEEGLKQWVKTIGLYKTKARNIFKTCQILEERFQGVVPHTREELESLPGVGRKTANVVLNIAFNQSVIAVDTHVFRVSNRTRLAPGKTPEAVEEKLMHIVPKTYIHNAHHWLILHGRYVCKARQPLCYKCVVRDLCAYPDKTKNPES